jgi:hypothetical protein
VAHLRNAETLNERVRFLAGGNATRGINEEQRAKGFLAVSLPDVEPT